MASLLLHVSKPCLISCQGEERRVIEEVQPPPGSQDWDVLLTHRAGLWGPLREGSRHPHPAGQDQGCSSSHWPPGGTAVPSTFLRARSEAPGPLAADVSSSLVKDPGPLPGGLAKQVVIQPYYVSPISQPSKGHSGG